MRATLTLAALTMTALMAAGTGTALVPIYPPSPLVLADHVRSFADQLGTDLDHKADLARSVAEHIAGNLGGQAEAAADLALQVAGHAHDDAREVVHYEFLELRDIYDQVGDCVFGLNPGASPCHVHVLIY